MPRKKAAKSDKIVREWHPPLKGAFLDALKTVRFITQACDKINVPRSTVYEWREADPAFMAAMEDSELRFVDDIREEVKKRAFGEDGRSRSDELLKVLAKARAPEFRESAAQQVQVSFVQVVSEKIMAIVERVIPLLCPHCGHNLDTRKRMGQEIGRMDIVDAVVIKQ